MGIVKIRHQGAWNTNHERPRISEVDDEVEEEGLLDAWDPSELAEVDCELAMVGDQICNIPYELYSLSNLNEILSLETWNSCLTEEERFYLAAHLPDIDQDTFQLTMKELLGGCCNLFFGSPLEKFFHGLKGGFYSLKVTCIRNSLQLLHKRRYYHSLRLYHESMSQRFTDMKNMSNCRPNSTMEERIQIWNNRRDPKPVLLVDLNALPTDEDTPLLKKTKHTNEGIKRDTRTIDSNNVAVNRMTKGKGLLKVRSVEVSSTQTHLAQPWSRETREELGRRQPKGVLKIKPKIDTFGQLERPMTTPIPSCYASEWHEVIREDQDTMRGVEKDLVFPITYQRKKGYTRLNPTEPLRQPSMVMKLKSVETSRADYHPTEEAKSVKIKVKGWSDYNAQYKRGLLNGSPST